MVRKIFKTGNSLVISLPKSSMEQLGLQEGSEVLLTVEPEEGRLIIEPAKKQIVEIDPTFAQQLDDFIEQYRPALEALAK
jgi:putative addiction module antidote